MVTRSQSRSIVVRVSSTGQTCHIKASPDETIAEILPRIAQAASISITNIQIFNDSGEALSPDALVGPLHVLHLVAMGRAAGEIDKAQSSAAPEKLLQFWQRSWRDLKHNAYLLWPVLLAIVVYWLASGFALHHFESRFSIAQALYLTWITMTTVGFGDITPATSGGRLLVSIDALVGIVLIGIVVWLITSSLQKT